VITNTNTVHHPLTPHPASTKYSDDALGFASNIASDLSVTASSNILPVNIIFTVSDHRKWHHQNCAGASATPERSIIIKTNTSPVETI